MIEALVTLSVVAILLAVGLPQMGDYVQARAIKSKVSAISSAMRLARTEAVKRGTRVTVCPSLLPNAAAPVCDNGNNWQTGWIIFSDRGAANVVDAGLDQIIRIQDAFTDTGSMVSAGGSAVNFFPNGIAIGGQREFQVLPEDTSDGHFARKMCQTAVGSSRIVKYSETC